MGPAIRLMVKIPPRITRRVTDGLGYCCCAWRAIHVPTKRSNTRKCCQATSTPSGLEKRLVKPDNVENALGDSAGPWVTAQQNKIPYIKASNAWIRRENTHCFVKLAPGAKTNNPHIGIGSKLIIR